jgi:hypothetical protein
VELRTGRFGQRDQIPDLVSEILALKVDVIVAGSPLVITALKQATTTAGGGMRGASVLSVHPSKDTSDHSFQS